MTTAPKTPWNPSESATARVTNPLSAPTTCPHCGGEVSIVQNSVIYNGRSYGSWPWVYLCANRHCGAYVGMHPFTAIPLGTLATAEIRAARAMAKSLFNPLWQTGKVRRMSRSQAYARLAEVLGIPAAECHFGWFTAEQCRAAAAAIKEGKIA
jgi:hypothetical protein